MSFTLSGTPNANGWFRADVTIRWSVAEPEGLSSTSGCEIAQLVTTEGTTSHTCTATSHGGTASSTATLHIDKTLPSIPTGAPARQPDSNGWFNHAVTIPFTATDAVSGIDTCTVGAYNGPDSPTASVPGTCTDRAGNSSSGSFALKYDSTPPTATVAASRAPDRSPWYNAPLSITFAQAPGDLSGPGSCRAQVNYSGPDSANASVSGTCTDAAGNTSAPVALGFKYDDTPPQATASPSRAPNPNGWYNAPLTIAFTQVAGDVSGQSACSPAVSYAGPDAASVSRSGTCTDGAGNQSAAAALTFAYDASAPAQPTATPARAPEATGWYRSSLNVGFASTDNGPSGIATCSAPTYAGPDSATAAVNGTCTDRAGNVSPVATLGFRYDATAPAATASASRPPNGNGWYNAPVTITFAQAPGDVSGTGSCTSAAPYGGPDAASASRSGTCTDGAGNPSAPTTLSFKYDASPPAQPSATPARGPDANGWYNRALGIVFAGADIGPAGIEACTAMTYTGPDSAAASVGGSCTDKAGNTSTAATFAFKYDDTAPPAVASASRPPNANGWHNAPFTISFSSLPSDVSGTGTCSPAVTYAGPDAAIASSSGTCTDGAGNQSAPTAYAFGYDASPPALPVVTPARAPDANGWYNRELAFARSATDLGPSGVEACSSPVYAGPDSASASVAVMCVDAAGNASPVALFGFKYDATPPVTTAVPDRGDGSWYREPVTVAFVGSDAASGVAACSPPATYSGPDTGGTALGGGCTDAAGNGSTAAFTVKYDATPPSLSVGLGRAPDSNGWYNRAVGVVAGGSDATSGLASCSAPSYRGPDTGGVSLSASCSDHAGNSAGGSVSLRYDATPPAVTASADRPADGAGWYRRAFTVSFAGADPTSGIESCTAPVRYAGPDRVNGLVAGTCRDHAGNAAESVHAFRYDGTAPAVGKLALKIVNGVARLSWQRSRDAVSVVVTRTPGRSGGGPTVVYRGTGTSFADRSVRNGTRYRYAVTVADAAGNSAAASVAATVRPALYRPAAGAVVRAPLTLGWEAVEGARFYNVQLLRGGVKILSTWPLKPTARIKGSWRYGGKRYRLEPGTYTWWVWAARGTRAQPQYGRPIGSSRFVVNAPLR